MRPERRCLCYDQVGDLPQSYHHSTWQIEDTGHQNAARQERSAHTDTQHIFSVLFAGPATTAGNSTSVALLVEVCAVTLVLSSVTGGVTSFSGWHALWLSPARASVADCGGFSSVNRRGARQGCRALPARREKLAHQTRRGRGIDCHRRLILWIWRSAELRIGAAQCQPGG